MESFTIKKMTFLRQISILMVLLAVKLTGDVKYYDISQFHKFICIASFDVTSGNFNSHKDYEDEDFFRTKISCISIFSFYFFMFFWLGGSGLWTLLVSDYLIDWLN